MRRGTISLNLVTFASSFVFLHSQPRLLATGIVTRLNMRSQIVEDRAVLHWHTGATVYTDISGDPKRKYAHIRISNRVNHWSTCMQLG